MTDRLTVYNNALGHLGERRLAGLAERNEPRRVLDDYWDQTLAYCLERKLWNFAYRAVRIDASSSIEPAFGFTNAFTIPDDWIRTRLLSASESLSPPLLQVREEAGYWYANIDPLFVQYNSRDPLYGMNLGQWPASFADYVELRLARLACMRIAKKTELLQLLIQQEKRAYTIASANCAMNDAVGFAPVSSWVRSRRGLPGGGDSPGGGSLLS